VVNGTIWWWYVSRDPEIRNLLIATGLIITLSLATYALIVGKTFFAASPSAVGSSIQMHRSRPAPMMRSR
jgi:hypothetical protein